MTSSPSLCDMPEVVMKNLFEMLGFEAILVLRKVCRDLRHYIDDVKPELHVKDVCIDIYLNSICCQLNRYQKKETIDEDEEDEDDPPITEIIYEKTDNGCAVSFGDKKKLIENMDPIGLFSKDLSIIFRYQKTPLSCFRVEFDNLEDSFISKHLQILTNNLGTELQVEQFYMDISLPEHLSLVLPSINPEKLKEIHMSLSHFVNKEKFDISKVVHLEQWKQAEEVGTHRVYISTPLHTFCHFSKASIILETISLNDLVLLKEHFLQSSSPKTLNIKADFIEQEQLLELFGQPFHKDFFEIMSNKWFFRIPCREEVVEIYLCQNRSTMLIPFTTFDFSLKPLSSVPEGALIID